MSDSISISFRNGDEESIYLFHRQDGEDFLDRAQEYINNLPPDEEGGWPLDRREPQFVMVDFIRIETEGKGPVTYHYVGKDSSEGDNWNNGHFVIDCSLGGEARILEGELE